MKILITFILLFLYLTFYPNIKYYDDDKKSFIPIKEYFIQNKSGQVTYLFIKDYNYKILKPKNVIIEIFIEKDGELEKLKEFDIIKPNKSQIYYIKYSTHTQEKFNIKIFAQKK